MVIVRTSPKDRVVGPFPNGRFMASKLEILTTYKSWDDPPNTPFPGFLGKQKTSPLQNAVEHLLVGGFNSFETYLSNLIISPSREENKKSFNTTT